METKLTRDIIHKVLTASTEAKMNYILYSNNINKIVLYSKMEENQLYYSLIIFSWSNGKPNIFMNLSQNKDDLLNSEVLTDYLLLEPHDFLIKHNRLLMIGNLEEQWDDC